jgi:hypothetical protein
MLPGSLKHWVLRSCVVLSALGALVAEPAAARADVPVDAAVKRAREQFGQALTLQTAGDWSGALALLKEVAAVKPTPQVRFNIALCEERIGRLVAALGDYELAGSDAQAAKAEQVRQEVELRLESLRARVPRIVVQRGVGADAASISLDGVALGDSVLDLPLPADPGPHVVAASAAGFLPFKQSFRIAEQQTATVQVKLELEPVKTKPTPPLTHAASPGLRSAGYVVGGAGIAGLVASGALFYLRHTTLSDLDQQCGPDRSACPESARNTADRGKLYTTLGNVTLTAGALGLGIGAVLVIVGGRQSVSLAPGAAGADRGGASLLGRF